MLVSNSHRFIFIHIGKTGGMSMREILRPLCTEPDKFKMRRPAKLIGGKPNPMYSVWETLLLHAKARDAKKELPEDMFDSYFKFAFVRNPWDLQVSMYHFVLREPTAPRHTEVKALGSFDAFVEWVTVTADPYPKGITKRQSDMITDDHDNLLMDFVGHYETLREDFTYLRDFLGIDAELPHLNKSQHQDYRAYYTPRTRTLVEDHFAGDIERFGYTFDGLREPSLLGAQA